MQNMTIGGVVEDFNLVSMHDAIEPVVLAPASVMGGGTMAVSVRIRRGSASTVIPALRKVWEQLAPDKPFRYEFLQDVIADQYRGEMRWQSIVAWAGMLAVTLACFGLLGLALLSTRRRIREIGIRKVLGASTTSLVALLSREYAGYVLAASVLAVPLAWYASDIWLDGFAFRAEIRAWIFPAAGLGTLLIAFATTSLQVVRAALSDPVDSLRAE
jgi:putative ABC transport system permease protein